jgi:hypothetical protein
MQIKTLFGCLAIAMLGTSLEVWAKPAKMKTRDINDAIISCIPSNTFIVSLNDDNDDGNNQSLPDYNDAALSARDDNLRKISFIIPGAEFVTLGQPTLIKVEKTPFQLMPAGKTRKKIPVSGHMNLTEEHASISRHHTKCQYLFI